MPQIQVLPRAPSFGERLVPVLTQAFGDIGEGYQKKLARDKFNDLLNPQSRAPTGGASGENPMGQMEQIGAQSTQKSALPTGLKGIELIKAATEAYGPETGKYVSDYIGDLRKAELKEDAKVRESERELLQPANKAFFEDVQNIRNTVNEQELASEATINAIMSGETGTFSSANIGSFLEELGAPSSLRKAFETPGSKEFKSAGKTFLSSNMNDTFKGTTTGREIKIAEEIGAELGVNENANLASAVYQKVKIDIKREKLRLADEALEQGVSPSKVPSVVSKRLEPYIKKQKNKYFQIVETLGFTGKENE